MNSKRKNSEWCSPWSPCYAMDMVHLPSQVACRISGH